MEMSKQDYKKECPNYCRLCQAKTLCIRAVRPSSLTLNFEVDSGLQFIKTNGGKASQSQRKRASTLLLDNGTNRLPLQQVTLTADLICLHHQASNQGNKYSLIQLHVLLRFDKKNSWLS
jgi:hypothetical protein